MQCGSVRHRPGCLRPAGFPCASCRGLVWIGFGIGGRRRGQVEMERAALAGLGFCPDATAMAFDDALHDRKADAVASALVDPVQAVEWLEQLVRITHVETGAVVA